MVATRTTELAAAYEELRTSEERFAQAFHNSPMPQAIQTIRAQRFVDVNDAFLAMTGYSRASEFVGRTPPWNYGCAWTTRHASSRRGGEGRIVRNKQTRR